MSSSSPQAPSKEQLFKMRAYAKMDQALTQRELRTGVFMQAYVRNKLIPIFNAIKEQT